MSENAVIAVLLVLALIWAPSLFSISKKGNTVYEGEKEPRLWFAIVMTCILIFILYPAIS